MISVVKMSEPANCRVVITRSLTVTGILNISLHLNVEMYLKRLLNFWLYSEFNQQQPAVTQVSALFHPDSRGTNSPGSFNERERDLRCQEESGECQLYPEEASFKVTAGSESTTTLTWSREDNHRHQLWLVVGSQEVLSISASASTLWKYLTFYNLRLQVSKEFLMDSNYQSGIWMRLLIPRSN